MVVVPRVRAALGSGGRHNLRQQSPFLDLRPGRHPLTVSVPFSYMTQEGWGTAYPFDLGKMMTLHWLFRRCNNGTCYTTLTSFDMCVGNVTFF